MSTSLFACTLLVLSTSVSGDTTTDKPCATGPGEHHYACDTTDDCCVYWQDYAPGTECQAACTDDAEGRCNYCYLTSSSTTTTSPTGSGSGSGVDSTPCATGPGEHHYACDTTDECCSYWEAIWPGTDCQAACTENESGVCNYCYLTNSTDATSSSSGTGTASGCGQHEYPCDTTADCCAYWVAHFGDTECQASCTEDKAEGCNYCYLTSSSTPQPIFQHINEADMNAMNGGSSWLHHGDLLMHSSFASLSVLIMSVVVIAVLLICRNGVFRGQVAKEKLLLQPQSHYGSV